MAFHLLSTDDPVKARSAIGIGGVASIIDRATPRALPELFTSFAGKADASSAPSALDSGQNATIRTGLGTSPQHIILDGALTNQPTNHGSAASYYVGHCTGNVTRIGGRVKFWGSELNPVSPTDNGCATLGVLKIDDWSGGVPTMALHLLIKHNYWGLGVWDGWDGGNTGLDVVASGTFIPEFLATPELEREVQVWFNGTTVTVDLPDGSRHTVTDSRFSSFIGPHVFWENQYSVADTDNRTGWTHLWASSGKQYIPQHSPDVWLFTKHATASSTVTLTASTLTNVPGLPATGAGDYFIVPPSGSVLARFNCWVNIPTAAEISAFINSSAGLTGAFVVHPSEGIVQKRIYFEEVITGLTPGIPNNVTPQVMSSVSDTQIIVDPAGYYGATLTVEPA